MKPPDFILGADISWLPKQEARGRKLSDGSVTNDIFAILKEHQFNWVRLRLFHNPRATNGYSVAGFCDLEHTTQMARRARAAGMHFLLDLHYSDTWADPGKQFKPQAWQGLDFDALVKAGIAGVREADPSIRVMLHIACGGQNTEARSFLDNTRQRGVEFDILGQSYYPRYHGTTNDLRSNLNDLAGRYPQPIIVAEYSEHKRAVNEIAHALPNGKGLGTFIWEPTQWGEALFDRTGHGRPELDLYPQMAQEFRGKPAAAGVRKEDQP